MERKIHISSFFKSIAVLFFIFSSAFIYLNQKVFYFIEAYRISKNYAYYRELVDKRDYLLYNLSKRTTLPKVAKWAHDNNFFLAKEESIIALKPKTISHSTGIKRLASLVVRTLHIPIDISKALAKDK